MEKMEKIQDPGSWILDAEPRQSIPGEKVEKMREGLSKNEGHQVAVTFARKGGV